MQKGISSGITERPSSCSRGSSFVAYKPPAGIPSTADAAAIMRGDPVPPEAVYFRCQPRFETGDARWAWLGERQFIGRGERLPGAVRLSFWQVL